MVSFSVNFLFLSCLLYIIQRVYSNHADDYIWDCPSNTSVCLSGGKHKTIASPEDSSYGACYDYQNLSCCTSNFTQQLATSDVTHIQDGDTIFNWTHCGSISETCEAYLIEIECFYRCSPLMIYFAGDYPSSLDYVPMCSSFCDSWYDACKDDLTCVDNWIFDWEYDSETGENICPSNSTCQTFESWYKNSTQLCNVLWGNSFQYTDDSDSDNYCLTPGDYDNNVDAVDAIFDVVCETHEPTSVPTAVPGSSDNGDTSDSDEYIWDCPSNTSVCLSGGKHKTVASPEDDTYAACLDYQDLSCCTSNFTQQLATSDVTHIQDGDTIFNWTHCGAISESCEAYLIEIECFYRCSPLMIYFAGDYPSSLDYVPMCSSFCDSWYDACKDDLTCVDNWIFDWEYDSETGENVCPDDSTCQTFETWYKNSTQLCNVLWGNSFEYTDDSDSSNYCLTPGDYDNNVDAVDAIFDVVCGTEDEGNDDESNESDDGTVVIVVVIAVTVILVAIIVVIVMKKNSQKPTVGYEDNGATTR